MFKTDNSLHVFVGDTYHNAANDTDTISAAATNAIFICRPDGTAYDSAANKLGGTSSDTKFKIGQKDADGNVRWSPVLDIADVQAANAVEASAGTTHTEQVNSIGYTGSQTSASIEAINSNRYALRVSFKHDTDMYSEQADQHFFEYVSDANATQIEIANGFVQNMSKNKYFSGKTTGKDRANVKVERFTSTAGAVISTDITTATVTNGSKFITNFTFGSGTDISGMSAGNYLMIVTDGDVDTTPVVTTDAIYKIVSVDNTNDIIELDQPFQATGAALEDIAFTQITAANMATYDVGIRITGLEQEYKAGRYKYNVVAFDVVADGWGTTTVAKNTSPLKCTTCARTVADLEWFGAAGSAGAVYRGNVFPGNDDLYTLYSKTTTSDLYDVVHISAKTAAPQNLPVSGVGDPGQVDLVIAIDDAGTTPTDMMDVLGGITGLAIADLD